MSPQYLHTIPISYSLVCKDGALVRELSIPPPPPPPSTNVVQVPAALTPHVGSVCCWFYYLIWECPLLLNPLFSTSNSIQNSRRRNSFCGLASTKGLVHCIYFKKDWSPCDFHVENYFNTHMLKQMFTVYRFFVYSFFLLFFSVICGIWTFSGRCLTCPGERRTYVGKKYTPRFPIVVTLFFSSKSTGLRGDSDWDLKDYK